jgi:broad specificity phosphatase PhoE
MDTTHDSTPARGNVVRAMSERILMVRHGESDWNRLGKWQGRADTSLTNDGRQQARNAARRLRTLGLEFDSIAASSLSRARETAEIIARDLGLPAPMIDERLVETDVGPWQGLREAEIEAGWPNFLRERRTPPDFEPPHAVFARVTAALNELFTARQSVLVVSHSGVIRTLRRVMDVQDRRLHNLEGCYFDSDTNGNLIAGDFVTLINDLQHNTNDTV